jgi:predicted RNA binding protein YcfA (HicA-like mRNA interferase family)
MPPLPVLNHKEVIATFERMGWHVARQQGSHIVMIKEGHIATLSIPAHKEVARGTLRGLIRAAGVSVSEFCEIYKNL